MTEWKADFYNHHSACTVNTHTHTTLQITTSPVPAHVLNIYIHCNLREKEFDNGRGQSFAALKDDPHSPPEHNTTSLQPPQVQNDLILVKSIPSCQPNILVCQETLSHPLRRVCCWGRITFIACLKPEGCRDRQTRCACTALRGQRSC